MPAIESSTTAPANIEKMYNIYINLDIFLSPFSAFSFAAILRLTCQVSQKNGSVEIIKLKGMKKGEHFCSP